MQHQAKWKTGEIRYYYGCIPGRWGQKVTVERYDSEFHRVVYRFEDGIHGRVTDEMFDVVLRKEKEK